MTNSTDTQQRHLFEVLFDQAPIGLAILDQNKIIRRCNAAWGKTVLPYFPGASQVLQPGVHLLEFLPDSRARHLPLFERALTSETVEVESFELENNGIISFWDLTIVPFTDSDQTIALLCAMIDVTKCVLAQQELMAQEENYRQVRQLAILDERDRLARALHDRLAQALGTIKIRASLAQQQLQDQQLDQARDSLQTLRQITDDTYTDVREAIFNLRTKVFGGENFAPTLKSFLVEYKMQYGIDTQLVVESNRLANISTEAGRQLIRIIQEALSNVRKHAQARLVTIRCVDDTDRLVIEIIDNGRGFNLNPVNAEGPAAFGLEIMQERAASVGGDFSIASNAGNGVTITIRLPVA